MHLGRQNHGSTTDYGSVFPLVIRPQFNIDAILAIVDIFPRYPTLEPVGITMDCEPTKLNTIFPEEPVIAHPVGEQYGSKAFPFGPGIVSARRSGHPAEIVIQVCQFSVYEGVDPGIPYFRTFLLPSKSMFLIHFLVRRPPVPPKAKHPWVPAICAIVSIIVCGPITK